MPDVCLRRVFAAMPPTRFSAAAADADADARLMPYFRESMERHACYFEAPVMLMRAAVAEHASLIFDAIADIMPGFRRYAQQEATTRLMFTERALFLMMPRKDCARFDARAAQSDASDMRYLMMFNARCARVRGVCAPTRARAYACAQDDMSIATNRCRLMSPRRLFACHACRSRSHYRRCRHHD